MATESDGVIHTESASVLVEAPAAATQVATAEPAKTTTGAVLSAAKTSWNWTKCAARVLNGLRTLLFFGTTGILAIGSKIGDIDVAGFVSRATGAKVDAADIVVFMSVSGIVLRWLTTTPVFARWKKAATGAIQEDASAAVDDPDDTSK